MYSPFPESVKRRPRPCWCGGYWFPHRVGGGACFHGERADYYAQLRAGVNAAYDAEDELKHMIAIGVDHPTIAADADMSVGQQAETQTGA